MASDLPEHLAGDRAAGWVEGPQILQFEIGSYRNFVYLILDPAARAAAIVDPQSDLRPYWGPLAQAGYRLEGILLTHTHHDHVAGLPALARERPGIRVWVHADDAHRLESDGYRLDPITDGQSLAIGAHGVEVLHTPGHSAGECCFRLRVDGRDHLFTGDTVFIRDCGRTDLPTGSTRQMFETLQRLKQLPAETVLLPGHHYRSECATTLGRELRESPPFQCSSVAELEALP